MMVIKVIENYEWVISEKKLKENRRKQSLGKWGKIFSGKWHFRLKDGD